MAQPQRQADVHQDELCPPKKRYALMDANKKIDLNNPKELTMTLDDFRTIFQLPQAIDNNHEHFVAALKFLEMVPFYINNLGFTLELRSPSNFKTTDLVPTWQTLWLYCFVNNIRVDYADLLWEGFHYSLEHLTTLIPYPRFTKLIVSHYMTAFPEISRRDHDKYHNLDDDVMVKNIFNSGKNKDGVGMKIPSWMITDEMKLTEHYQMYAAVFGNEAKVKEHLMVEEFEKLVGGTKNVGNDEVDNSISHSQNDPDTRLEPRSNMKRPKVEKTAIVSQPVNVIEEEDESTEDDYELKRTEKWKNVEESRHTPSPTTIRSPKIHSTLISSDTEKL
ncbi:hypothetical protein Tco_0665013 [Tanacetum coccineum]